MDVGLLFTDGGTRSPVEVARRAESLGYDSFWTAELWGEHSFVRLARVAEHTDDLGLGTAIVNVFSRTPAVLAMAAASLQEASGGRFRLGLGASTRQAIEGLHGLSYERPVRRTHETVELVREFTAGDGRVAYDGELFQVMGVPALDAEVPVYNAALGPANRRLTGRLCDGWIPHNVPFPALDDAFEVVAESAREAGRDPAAIEVAPYVPAAVAADPAEARAAIRGHVAYYVGSGEGYRRAVASAFPEAAERVAEAWQGGDRDAAREAVTDEMVSALGVAGTPEEAREQFREVLAIDAVTEPMLVVPAQAAEALAEETVEALAPEKL